MKLISILGGFHFLNSDFTGPYLGTKYLVGTQLIGASELGVHSYINLKILGGHVPVCPLYRYGPDFDAVIRFLL